MKLLPEPDSPASNGCCEEDGGDYRAIVPSGGAGTKATAAVAQTLAVAEGTARLLVKAMAVAERVGTRFYGLRQVR